MERIIAESLYCPKETDPPEFTLLKRVLEAARQPLEDEELYVPEAIRLIYWLGEDLSEAERNHAPECPGIVVKYLERFGATGNARPDKPMIRPPHIQLPPGTDERGWRAMLLLGTEAAEVYHALEGKTFFTAADVGVFRHEGKCFCLAFVPLFEILE